MIFRNHSQVSISLSLHFPMPRKLNSPLLLFLNFGVRVLAQVLHILYWGVWKVSFGNFGYIWHKAHVKQFKLYPTSSHSHSRRQVKYLQQFSCCFYTWDLPITWTMYASVACTEVFKACFVHGKGRWLRYGCTIIPQLTTWWCSILETAGTDALLDCEVSEYWQH